MLAGSGIVRYMGPLRAIAFFLDSIMLTWLTYIFEDRYIYNRGKYAKSRLHLSLGQIRTAQRQQERVRGPR